MSKKRPTNDPVFVEATLQDIAALAARHGYAVVPVEPSEQMLSAAHKAQVWSPELGPAIGASQDKAKYRAMIEAGRVKP